MKKGLFWQLILFPIVFIIIAAGTIAFTNISNLQRYKQEQIEKVSQTFLDEQRRLVREKVMFAISAIEFGRSRLTQSLQEKLQSRVNDAIKIATLFYETNKDLLTEEQLKDSLKTIFGALHFDTSDEYLFVIDLANDINIVNQNPKIVGFNMQGFRDSSGRFSYQEAKKILKSKDHAFQEIIFPKPSQKGKESPKLLYYQKFHPFNWLIGTGEYLDDFEKQMQYDVLERLNNADDNVLSMYLFVHQVKNLEGGKDYATMLLNKNLLSKEGESISSLIVDSKGFAFREEFLEIARKQGEGYVTYWHPLPSKEVEGKKTSFIYFHKDWQWIIGSGFYYDGLDAQILKLESDIGYKISKDIQATLLVTLIVILLTGTVSYLISQNFGKVVKRYAHEVEAQKNRFKTLFKKSADGILLMSSERIYDCNEAILKMFEYDSQDIVLSKTYKDLSPLLQGDGERSAIKGERIIEQCLKEGTCHVEWLCLKSTGALFWTDVTLTRLELEGDVILHILVKDIDDRKRLEEENTKQYEVLTQQSKMAAMGEMMGNIAHQWRQPLSIISMEANNVLLDIGLKEYDEKKTKTHIQGILKQTKGLSETIENFGDFFQPEQKMVTFKLKVLMESALKMMHLEFTTLGIEVAQEIEDVDIVTYKRELMQVLINILSNARDALVMVETKRLLTIAAYETYGGVTICIKDNAEGYDKHLIERIMAPSFNTKHTSKGTRVGLYMAQEIITKHMNGTLDIQNTQYTYETASFKGTKFIITLPKS